MKPRRVQFLPCALTALALLSGPARANEAQMYFTSLSMKVPPAAYSILGQQYRLAFTTTDDGTINSEVFAGGGSGQYESWAILDYPGSEALGAIEGFLSLTTPFAGDSNVNGITDFLEVDRAVQAEVTNGTIEVDDGMDVSQGTITATWTRAAGSTTGTVRMVLNIDDFGFADLTFNHTFEIFSYRGTLTYTPGSNAIPASVNLERLGAPGTFTGAMNLTRLSQVELERERATWVGPGGVNFDVLGSGDIEDVPLPISYVAGSLYAGLIVFADGDPSTPFTDEFDFFDVIISDPNDADADGLPDLSDAAAVVPPVRATVAASVVGGGVQIRVTGAPGTRQSIERAAALSGSGWAKVGEVTLDANGRADFNAGTPTHEQAFFRSSTAQ